MHAPAVTPGAAVPTPLRARFGGASREARVTALATLVFLGVAIWWLTQETRTPDFDSAMHMLYAFGVHENIAHGRWDTLFEEWNTYPPLGHVIGAIGVFIGGFSPSAVILALDLVFVPLLAASCYGVGRLVAGPRAGLLAAIFALGTPMIVSEAHEAYLDPTQAAFVAAAVWGILASERFERWGLAALGGLATGLALMTKETSPVFIVGILAVVVVRGGWRHWRGLLAYAIPLGVVAVPWYFNHRTLIHQLLLAHSVEANAVETNPLGGGTYPTLFSLKNVSWYFWDAANIQLRAGLLLLFILGTVAAIRSCVKHWGPRNLYPELLGGALVSWLGMTWLTHKDPRYDLPALIYVAVIATAWIVTTGPRVRPWLLATLFVSVAASFASVAFGLGGTGYQLRAALPGAFDKTPLGARYITFYSTTGWARGAPDNHDGNILSLMRALRRAGIKGVAFCCVNPVDFSIGGLQVFAISAGLPDIGTSPAALASLAPNDVFLLAHGRTPGDPPPCQTFDGIGIYAELGNPLLKPFSQEKFICPGRRPEIYGHT